VAGIDEVKEELAEIVEFLGEPDRFRRLGATIPKGVLLTGLRQARQRRGCAQGRSRHLPEAEQLSHDSVDRAQHLRRWPAIDGSQAGEWVAIPIGAPISSRQA
jgi:hypothetical protein